MKISSEAGRVKEKEELISQLESSWLTQLVREFENICYQYDVDLLLPVLQLTRNKRVLGSWRSSGRMLSISGYLILQHPWNVTLQVLKHEMAHQICSELFLLDDLNHGVDFKKACQMLGIEKQFQQAGADNWETLAYPQGGSSKSPDHHILDKIKKLMALGQSCNEHEAKFALNKATSLLAQHNLTLASLAEDKQLGHLRLETNKQRLPVYLSMILSLLDKWFFVRVIITSGYHPFDRKTYKTIELFGTEENVLTAEYCYQYLLERLDAFWQLYKQECGSRQRISRKSYYLGLLTGFEESLATAANKEREHNTELPEDCSNALMVLENRIDRFVEYYYPKLKKHRKSATRIDKLAFDSARKKGRTLKLNRPLKDKEKGQRFLT